jgi:uncharacterized protein (DUF433 family)
MNWQERIIVDPNILVGKPIIKGTRLSVELILEQLAAGWTVEDIIASYPTLTGDDIRACLHFAAEILRNERSYPLPAA